MTAFDRGYLHAWRMENQLDLIIGDFDSASVPEEIVPVEQHASRKDDTDTMLVVIKKLLAGYDEILIACGVRQAPGSQDGEHRTGAYIAEHGDIARLFGVGTEAAVFRTDTRMFPHRGEWNVLCRCSASAAQLLSEL